MENHYVVRLTREKSIESEVIKTILAAPQLARLLFPAEMYAGFIVPIESIDDLDASLIKTISLDSVEDFDASLIPKDDIDRFGTRILLRCQNGLDFSMMANSQEIISGFVNIFFSPQHLKTAVLNYDTLKAIIFELVPIFQPIDGTIYDKRNKERLRYYSFPSDFNSYPLEIGWISYFSPYLVESIGREKFQQLQSCAEKVEFNGGFLISSVPEPFQADNKLHLECEAQIIADLGLEAFVKF